MRSAAKPFKIPLFAFAIIAVFSSCLLLAACDLRTAQSSDTAFEPFISAPPLPQGMGRDATLRSGRDTVRLLRERDAKTVFAKFTPTMARAFPLTTVQELLAEDYMAFKNSPPVGEIVSGTETAPIYFALYSLRKEGKQMAITVGFASDRASKISVLRMDILPKPTSQAAVIQQGRVVSDLVAKKNGNGLYALFAPNMVKAFPKTHIVEVLEEMVTAQKPVGSRMGEIAAPASSDDDNLLYAAEFAQGPGDTLKILMSFTPDGQKLTNLRLIPSLPKTLAPDPHARYQMKTPLRLPFAPGDKWTISWGGDTRQQNYHVDSPDQRHAFDILAVEGGKTHTGDGKQLSQYFAWGRKIIAPADAVVVEAVDGLPDNAPGQMDADHPAGNHIVLDLGSHEYAVLAHLQKGSVHVKTGQKIKTGDLLGLCGNSGHTSEPHLHFHVQDGPVLFQAKGLPVTFRGYVSGGKAVAAGSPVQGEVIEAGQ